MNYGRALFYEWLILWREIQRSYAHRALSHLTWCMSFLTRPSEGCWHLGGFLVHLQLAPWPPFLGCPYYFLGDFLLKDRALPMPEPHWQALCFASEVRGGRTLGSGMQTGVPDKCYTYWSGPQELKC